MILSRLKKSPIKSDLWSHSMKRLTTEFTPKRVQILDCITPWVQEQGYPPTFHELAHGSDLTEKNARDGWLILGHKGSLRRQPHPARGFSLRKQLPTAPFHDLPLVRWVVACKPIEVSAHQHTPHHTSTTRKGGNHHGSDSDP
jgi:SOS-response transcriptional repressor LexA